MLERVVWRDAFFDFDRNGQDDPESLKDEYLVSTVGYVVAESERFLRVAQEQLPDDDGFRAVTSIPKVCVVQRIPLMEVTLVL